MSDHPILFSGAMVRAILDGKKTQTRRVMKVRDGDVDVTPDHGEKVHLKHITQWWHSRSGHYHCPYGQPGDRLWVRETWLPDAPISGWSGDVEWNGCGRPISGVPDEYRSPKYCIFAASWDGIDLDWRPSIHMPRWASRITLELTDVRVQRLQDISEADATAEGCEASIMGHGYPEFRTEATTKFRNLWDTLNEKRGFGWKENPWVWALTFKRTEPDA